MVEALAHRQVLLQNLLHRTLALAILTSHKVDWIYEKGKKTAIGFVKAEKCKGIGAVVSIDVFEARTLDWYL